MKSNPRLLRITTVPISLHLLLQGQFTFFTEKGFEVLTVSAAGPEIEDLKAQGVAHTLVPMTRAITPWQDLVCLLRLIGVMRRFKPDIVHTHTPKAGLLGMMAAALCGVRVRLHTVAGLPLMESRGVKRRILIVAEWLTYRCAHKVMPNSKGLRDFILQQFGSVRSKVEMIGEGSTNGIDLTTYSRTPAKEREAMTLRSNLGISSEAIVFVFVGRIVRDKGVAELVSAFQQMEGILARHLLLVGPFEDDLDPLPSDCKQAIESDTRITIAGFQKDVRPWLLAADVFVFPSYREGFPNVVMQAACLEIPCIVSDINGSNELIRNEISGMVVPPKNVMQLRKAMEWMQDHPTERVQMATEARSFVARNFSRIAVWEELHRFYLARLGPEQFA